MTATRRAGIQREDIVEIVQIVLAEAGNTGLTDDEIRWVRARIHAEESRAELFTKLRDELAKKGIVALAILMLLALIYGWTSALQRMGVP